MEGVWEMRGEGSSWGGEAELSQTLKWSSRHQLWVKQSLLTRVRMDGRVCENIFQQGITQTYPKSHTNTLLESSKMKINSVMFLKNNEKIIYPFDL